MNMQKMLLTPNRYSRPQIALNVIKKIVVHWVGNAGATAINNRNYFEGLKVGTNKVYASSHYIIGLDGEVIQCVPENEVAYHAGNANDYSIGIENCHPDWDGKFNDATYKSLVALCADLCYRYKLTPEKDMLRHYDVTGKMCPLYYIKNATAWTKLKSDVTNALGQLMANANSPVTTTTINLNGTLKQVERILYNGQNYIKLRDLEDSHISIGYDSAKKTPIIQVK